LVYIVVSVVGVSRKVSKVDINYNPREASGSFLHNESLIREEMRTTNFEKALETGTWQPQARNAT